MASTTSLFTGLSGLNANARRLEVIGNNIANINTTAFKSNRLNFAPTFSRNLSLGTAPSAASGGTNPAQVGLGVSIAGTQRNFNNGAISTTGINTDLALEGDGFFIVNGAGEQFYSRAGAFQFNAANELVTQTGERVQGFGVDSGFNLISGKLQDLSIPLGKLTLAEATKSVDLSGNLNADGVVATQGTTLNISAAGITAGTDLLTTLGGGAAVVAGDKITVSGATRGGKALPDRVYTVAAASNVNNLMDFLQQALGVVPDGGYRAGDPTGAPEPGAYAVGAGSVNFVGNFGTANELDLTATNIKLSDAAGAAKASPFGVAKTASANGESVRTTTLVYDSLGSSVEMDVTMVLDFKDGTGTFWRSFLHSADDTDVALNLETGPRAGAFNDAVPLLHFDTFGRLISSASVATEIDRANKGSVDPLTLSLSFNSGTATVTALSNTGGASSIAGVFQDGSPIGTLSSFSVGQDGVITGGFTNGLTRTIGQLAVATFTNPEGLVDSGNNLFRVGPNSGTALVTEPLKFGTGRIVGGALELSNVDLSQEFINMILTSTGYSASSRVITTTDQLIQQLLVLGR